MDNNNDIVYRNVSNNNQNIVYDDGFQERSTPHGKYIYMYIIIIINQFYQYIIIIIR